MFWFAWYLKIWKEFHRINNTRPTAIDSLNRKDVTETLETVKFWSPTKYSTVMRNQPADEMNESLTDEDMLSTAEEQKLFAEL